MRSEEEIRANVIEQLAELEHEQWSTWVSILIAQEDNLSSQRLERYERLSKTEYRDLTEKEKDADRHWAEKAFNICMQVARVLNDKGEKP